MYSTVVMIHMMIQPGFLVDAEIQFMLKINENKQYVVNLT